MGSCSLNRPNGRIGQAAATHITVQRLSQTARMEQFRAQMQSMHVPAGNRTCDPPGYEPRKPATALAMLRGTSTAAADTISHFTPVRPACSASGIAASTYPCLRG